MTINYTTLLGLTEPVTGTQSGTWGSDINTGLTDYVEAAIAGAQVISGSQTAVTLSVTTGSSSAPTTLSQAGSGATGSSQYQIIRCTGNPASTLVIDVPKQDKTYIVINATSTSQTVTLRGGPSTPTTGVNIVAGEKAVCAWNGSDFVKVGGAAGGSNTQVQYNNNGVFGGVSGATTNGTAITFSTTNLKLQGSSTGVSSFASANSGATDYTVTFPAASTTIPVATQTLTFSGPTAARTITLPDANFTAARTDSAQTFTGVQTFSSNPVLSGGTANGVLYLNGSSVATSGSALTFDGTNLGVGGSGTSRIHAINNTDAFSIVGLFENTSTGTSAQSAIRVKAGTNTATWGMSGSGVSGAAAYFGSDQATPLLFYTGNSYQYWQTNGTERMRLDSSGNLGLGVTPSAWASTYRAYQVGQAGSLFGLTNDQDRVGVSSNAYFDTTDSRWEYIGTGYAMRYDQNAGEHQWYTAASGAANGAITFTQAMTLDASGNLGVGTTSPSLASGMGIAVYNSTVGGAARIALKNGSTGDASGDGFQLVANGVEAYIEQRENSFLAFTTNNTERARITSGGDLLVGKTATGSATAGLQILAAGNVMATVSGSYPFYARRDTTTGDLIPFNYNGTDVGAISTNGTSTTYGTSSDYRLKENIQPMTGALAKVAQLKPCTYNWKADGSDGEGFIAHELAEVVPQCVTGEKDAVDAEGKPVYQGIDTSFLVATLTAAIQEQQAIITSLTARVAALEGTQP